MSGPMSPARQCSTLEKGPWQQAVGYPAPFDVDNPSDHPLENRHAATGQERVHGSTARAISFGPFRLIPAQRLLLHAGKAVPLGSRALDILIALVERSGELLGKDELMARVWPNTFVEPANLTVHVAALRRALGDGRDGNRFIVNIPGRGYQFVAAATATADL
jgi:DNA-binding winged helix-turn-helix (wHTH) protein